MEIFKRIVYLPLFSIMLLTFETFACLSHISVRFCRILNRIWASQDFPFLQQLPTTCSNEIRIRLKICVAGCGCVKNTFSAAFRINNFAVWSHIAGTVRTQRMSLSFTIEPLSFNDFNKWSFRYLIAWEKTVNAFKFRPRISEIVVSIVNFYKTR